MYDFRATALAKCITKIKAAFKTKVTKFKRTRLNSTAFFSSSPPQISMSAPPESPDANTPATTPSEATTADVPLTKDSVLTESAAESSATCAKTPATTWNALKLKCAQHPR